MRLFVQQGIVIGICDKEEYENKDVLLISDIKDRIFFFFWLLHIKRKKLVVKLLSAMEINVMVEEHVHSKLCIS